LGAQYVRGRNLSRSLAKRLFSTTEQKALTNCKFGRGSDGHSLYLSSSDMERVTGYVYRATVKTPGIR
jgi:hypothetical protein